MTKRPKQNPDSRSNECDRLSKRILGIVNKAKSLFEHIDETEALIYDCLALGVNEDDNEFSALQAHKDWLELARPQLQLLREQFHHLLGTVPDEVKQKIGAELKLDELNRVFGEEDEYEEEIKLRA